ncbi:MAG: hypothetical protein O6909_08040 [Alphaproteobacteria bacterium]|nr:hypothetical protein [Alphaproteobacteria bacterium]MCZ6588718.1 hypothetical protein [Alphaproteobacteria bacterium]
MDFPALVQRIIYPRTDTPEAAWSAAANSGYAAAILAANRMLFGGLWLFSPLPVGPGLAHVGIGFVYVILARLTLRRSRIINSVILVLAVLESLIEAMLIGEVRFNIVIVAAAFVLAVGGFRGANAIFAHLRNPRR